MNATPNAPPTAPANWRTVLVGTPLGWVFTLAVAALGFYFVANHIGHIRTALPYLLLLACPLMNVLMHGGHGHHHRPASDNATHVQPMVPTRKENLP